MVQGLLRDCETDGSYAALLLSVVQLASTEKPTIW